MIRLDEIALREIRLPLREPFRISSGVIAERRIALLELRDADGATGWSECVAFEQPMYSPDTIDTAWPAGARPAGARHRKVKLKIQPGADIAYVAAVREALGPAAPLMADANDA